MWPIALIVVLAGLAVILIVWLAVYRLPGLVSSFIASF